MMENHYRTLGLDNFATIEEVKSTYRTLAKKYHPDRNQGKDDQFKRITVAYNELLIDDKRALLDEWLRAPKSTTTRSYRQPNYSKRTRAYAREKKFYSPKVKMQATIFTICFIMFVILVPVGMTYKASDYSYQEGYEFYSNGEYGKAVQGLNQAITWFGQRSGEASILGARMGMYKIKDVNQALYFIEKGIDYVSKREQLGELYYLKAKLLIQNDLTDSTFALLNIASELNYEKDSIVFEQAQIKAFYKEEFEQAAEDFESLYNKNSNHIDALFGQAWCTQRQNKPLESISLYNALIKQDSTHAMGLFYRGHNNIVLGDTITACYDFQRSYQLGYQPALAYLMSQCR